MNGIETLRRITLRRDAGHRQRLVLALGAVAAIALAAILRNPGVLLFAAALGACALLSKRFRIVAHPLSNLVVTLFSLWTMVAAIPDREAMDPTGDVGLAYALVALAAAYWVVAAWCGGRVRDVARERNPS